jgi:hypothetical protein
MLLFLMIAISGCSINPTEPNDELLKTCPRNLPELKQGTKYSLMEWRKEAGEQYALCRDLHDALLEFYKIK